ncbi:MAG: MarR family transcriptional regulator [Legionella sp.]|nr:MarR family transcriptional regulator [Legionella sp.]
MGIEQPTAVRTLDRMERDVFIHREQKLEDRWAIGIKLTDKGKGYQKILQVAFRS